MNIEETINFVLKAHGEQKYADCPYIVHLMLVARNFSTEDLIKVSLLHDILEDTKVTAFELYDKFGDDITNAVLTMTHMPEEEYLKEYILKVSKNGLARFVKMADLKENLFSINNFYPGRYDDLKDRYERALNMLETLPYE